MFPATGPSLSLEILGGGSAGQPRHCGRGPALYCLSLGAAAPAATILFFARCGDLAQVFHHVRASRRSPLKLTKYTDFETGEQIERCSYFFIVS